MTDGLLTIASRADLGGLPLEDQLVHGIASWQTPGTYTWLVPPGVSRILIDVTGAWARGGNVNQGCPLVSHLYAPMGPARVVHWVDVVPGMLFTIVIGASGVNAANGDSSTVTGLGVALTAGGGVPADYLFTTPTPVLTSFGSGSMAASGGGNVLSLGTGNGYCIIQW